MSTAIFGLADAIARCWAHDFPVPGIPKTVASVTGSTFTSTTVMRGSRTVPALRIEGNDTAVVPHSSFSTVRLVAPTPLEGTDLASVSPGGSSPAERYYRWAVSSDIDRPTACFIGVRLGEEQPRRFYGNNPGGIIAVSATVPWVWHNQIRNGKTRFAAPGRYYPTPAAGLRASADLARTRYIAGKTFPLSREDFTALNRRWTGSSNASYDALYEKYLALAR